MRKVNGITLIAFVITIIILLILATVSINLVINNGILDKAKTAVDKYSEGEICEQIKLAYLECETEKLYNSNVDDVNLLTNSLKEKLNDNNLTVKVKDGTVTVKSNSKMYIFKVNTGNAFEYVDPFDYKGKSKNDLAVGDVIKLTKGEVTENFTIISNTNRKIVAIPKYNITLTEDHPVQSSTAGTTTFSTEIYWTQGTDEIKINDSKNKIAKYVVAYKTTLEDMGIEGLTVRVAKKSELEATGITLEMRNPGQTGRFWLDCGHPNYNNSVWSVNTDGVFNNSSYDNSGIGVRPIIEIDY